MRTITVETGAAMRTGYKRRSGRIRDAVRKVACFRGRRVAEVRHAVGPVFSMGEWRARQVTLYPERDIELPGLLLMPRDGFSTILVHFDDKGRCAHLESGGFLASVIGMGWQVDRPYALLTVDVRGWGDSRPAMYPYEVYGWGSPDRYISYTSAALGDHIMAMRIRDACAVLQFVRKTCHGNPGVLVTGHGLGGVVALHAASIAGPVAGVAVWNCLWSYLSLAMAERYPWPADAFLPQILKYYDLPDLACSLSCGVRILNPAGGDGAMVDDRVLLNWTRRAPGLVRALNCDAGRMAREIRGLTAV